MPRSPALFKTDLLDSDENLVATVTRRKDYVAISRHEQLITVSLEDVPTLMRSLIAALNASRVP